MKVMPDQTDKILNIILNGEIETGSGYFLLESGLNWKYGAISF